MKELLNEIDELLTHLENYIHGKDGKDITEMRYKIRQALLQPVVSGSEANQLSEFADLFKAIEKINVEHYGSAINFIERYINTINNKKDGEVVLPDFEYEMFFKSEPDDFCKIDGWYPIATERIRKPEKIQHYLEIGLLRKIRLVKEF